jgi:hypothetical protein
VSVPAVDKLTLLVRDRDERGHKSVRIEVNGRGLIDLVEEVERPWAQAEGNPGIAGKYAWLTNWYVQLAAHLFGEAHPMYKDDAGGTALLVCECGEPGCWPLMARIERQAGYIVWSDFRQPHRKKWKYNELGPFRFDHAEYDKEVRGVSGAFEAQRTD